MCRQSKRVYGVGVNDADYVTQKFDTSQDITGKIINKVVWRCPFYDRWCGMLARAYSKPYKKSSPHYDGVVVCEDWHTFSNFKSWMEIRNWEGMELDKDLINRGAKEYNPENCSFVPREINILLTSRGKLRGQYPIGVTLEKKSGRYATRVNINGKHTRFGTYDTIEEAACKYVEQKGIHIKNVTKKWKGHIDFRVYESLMNWIISIDD